MKTLILSRSGWDICRNGQTEVKKLFWANCYIITKN